MTKSNGIASLKQAAKLLNKHSPDGESLAYINKDEAKLLRSHGGSGIKTLSTVPSYISLFGWDVPGTDWLPWETGTDVLKTFTDPYKAPTTDDNKPIFNPKTGERIGAPRSIVGDAMSVWAFLRAKKDKEGLNAAEMEQFNKLNQQLAAAETEFAVSTDFGTQLTAPQYETDITKSAAYTPIDFSGKDTPDLTIEANAEGGRIGYQNASHPLDNIALQMFGDTFENLNPLQQITVSQSQSKAQGGRIGAFNGGIQGLMPQQGFMPQPRLDPRMGYANAGEVENFNWGGPDVVETANMREEALFNNPIFDRDIQALEKEQTGKFEELVAQEENKKRSDLHMRLNKYQELVDVEDTGGRSIDALIKVAQGHGDNEVVGFLMQFIEETGPLSQNKTLPMGAAQGGRIGAQGGGIMPLLNMGGMEKDYRQDGGFVPIGRKEKADDVPARLSKNEFVFTADAVRAAGGGDIDQGAQRMYNVMKNLEAGGEISEQSQGQG